MNNDRSTKPTSKIRVLVGITGACVAVIAIVVLVYALTMPPSPEEVAESYIEDHYDAVAEAIVQPAFPDNPLTAEVIAEVAESIAERVIPYRCDVNKDYRATVGMRCDLSFSLDTPLELRIYAPFQVIMTTTDQDFLGRTTPVVQDANPIIDEMSVNGISLDKLTGIETKVKDVKEILDDLGLKIPNLQAEAVPQTQQPESTATGTPQPTEPTEPAPPTALPKEIAEAGICGRTPEVQERLIEALKIASCRRIDAAELYRIRKFSVTAQSFKAGDFDHLSNVQVMELELYAAKPVELSAGIFEDLQSLITLEIDSYNIPTIRLNKDTFRGLNNLIVLDIEYVEHLPEEALDHMQQLKQLNISYLKGDIPGEALDQLHNVQSISISAYTEENSNPRTIPADFLKNLPKLEKVSISKEYLPDSMEVNSYETACQIENWSLQDKEGNRISMTVDSKIVEVTDRTTDHDPINDRDVRICQFNVGDTETKKIIIPLE